MKGKEYLYKNEVIILDSVLGVDWFQYYNEFGDRLIGEVKDLKEVE